MNFSGSLTNRRDADPVLQIADLISAGKEIEAESELIALSETGALSSATRCQLARLSLEIEKPHLARGLLDPALKSSPRSPGVQFLVGLAEKGLGHLHESLSHFLLADPKANPDAAYYISIVSEELGDLDKAEKFIGMALAISAEDADYLNQKACVLSHRGDFEAALQASTSALAKEPLSPGLALNHAQNLLLCGQLETAWPLYEARHAFAPRHLFPQNESTTWEGQPLAGRSLLVWHEQGHGDTIQFSRFVPPLTDQAGHVIFRVQNSLVSLLRRLYPTLSIVSDDQKIPETDYHIPLLSLPAMTDCKSFQEVPAPPKTPQVHDLPPGRKQIGFCCQGNPSHPNDARRSIPQELFLPVLTASHDWYCLEQPSAKRWPEGIHRREIPFKDYLETAENMESLDLVIGVDSSITHLAASLGKTTWILISHTPDWRWGLHTETTPWYPSARLFRQPAPGDWSSVLRSVTADL